MATRIAWLPLGSVTSKPQEKHDPGIPLTPFRKVHEADLEQNYDILKEMLINFSSGKLPSVEEFKAIASGGSSLEIPATCEAAMALLAVTLNIFEANLYRVKGGKGRVKDCQGSCS